LICSANWRYNIVFSIAVLTASSLASAPALADFLDDARRTFQTDIPHFFQDDIPCAFGGQPTSHTKTSCKSAGNQAKPATERDQNPAGVRSGRNPPPSSGR
jgi:hypothetical protein